jgi:hypothetical protein
VLTDIKLGDQERNRQIAKVNNLANINRYTVGLSGMYKRSSLAGPLRNRGPGL